MIGLGETFPSDWEIELIGTKIIVDYQVKGSGTNSKLVDAFSLSYSSHQGVPTITLDKIKKNIAFRYGEDASIYVWEERGISGSIFHYNREEGEWVKHGKTRGYA